MRTLKPRKFFPHTSLEILNSLHHTKVDEGSKFHPTLAAAFSDYLNERGKSINSHKIVAEFTHSLQEFNALYKNLAK